MINESDKQFIRRVLMPYFGVRRVAVQTEQTKRKYPDITVQLGYTPLITVTPEWESHDRDLRRSQLTHEFIHISGLEHDPEIGYVSHPNEDVYSKAVYKHVTKMMTRINPEYNKDIVVIKVSNMGKMTIVYALDKYNTKHDIRTFKSTKLGLRDAFKYAETLRNKYGVRVDVNNPGATALTREGYSPGYFVQTPEQRKAKYKLARELGAKASLAERMRDWRSAKLFRWAGLPVPSLKSRHEMGLVNPYIR